MDLHAAIASIRLSVPDLVRTPDDIERAFRASGATKADAEWIEELSPRWLRGKAPDPFYEAAWNAAYHELRFQSS
jgi:hypothetical protein